MIDQDAIAGAVERDHETNDISIWLGWGYFSALSITEEEAVRLVMKSLYEDVAAKLDRIADALHERAYRPSAVDALADELTDLADSMRYKNEN